MYFGVPPRGTPPAAAPPSRRASPTSCLGA